MPGLVPGGNTPLPASVVGEAARPYGRRRFRSCSHSAGVSFPSTGRLASRWNCSIAARVFRTQPVVGGTGIVAEIS